MNFPRREFLRGAAAAGALFISESARAQAYPGRPVHILVGLAAGGGTDVAARVIAEWLSQQFNQQFVVENRTGMGGNLANQALVASPPDGHTLVFTGPNSTISAALYKKLPFNFLRDTMPVAAMMRFPNLMVVPTSLPVKNVAEFIAYAKAHPGELSLASSGVGASPHLSGELFKFMAKIDLVHVPYRGSAAAYPDLMTGTAARCSSSCAAASCARSASPPRSVGRCCPISPPLPRPYPGIRSTSGTACMRRGRRPRRSSRRSTRR
jgi:tripartite-type tricarboxylate transporter receptor subunit TctC